MLSEAAKKQGQLWGSDARTWASMVERTTAPLWDAVLDRAGAGPGVALLDAGCGPGGCARRAVARGATVSGFDPSEGMLEVAREAVPGAELKLGELGAIPFEDARFDAAIAVNSLQFSPDPAASLGELLRVVKPGGRAVVVVWDAPRSDNRLLFDAVRGLFEKPPSSRGAFELAFAGELESLLEGQEFRIDAVACPFQFASLDEALEGQLANGPSARAAEIFGRDRVTGVLREALESVMLPDGSVVLKNWFRAATITKRL